MLASIAWLLLLLFLPQVGSWLPGAEVHLWGLSYWPYLLMGALGGVTIALWGLIKHTIDLDFDPDYRWVVSLQARPGRRHGARRGTGGPGGLCVLSVT